MTLPFSREAEVFGAERDALFHLYSAILKGQQNFAVYPVDLDEYLGLS